MLLVTKGITTTSSSWPYYKEQGLYYLLLVVMPLLLVAMPLLLLARSRY